MPRKWDRSHLCLKKMANLIKQITGLSQCYLCLTISTRGYWKRNWVNSIVRSRWILLVLIENSTVVRDPWSLTYPPHLVLKTHGHSPIPPSYLGDPWPLTYPPPTIDDPWSLTYPSRPIIIFWSFPTPPPPPKKKKINGWHSFSDVASKG